jgi:hypothetical protein
MCPGDRGVRPEWKPPGNLQVALSNPGQVVEASNGDRSSTRGFSQFFFNASGDRTEDTVKALAAIGAAESAEVMREAIALYPGGVVPTDCQERRVTLANGGEELDALWENQDAEFWGAADGIVADLRSFVGGVRSGPDERQQRTAESREGDSDSSELTHSLSRQLGTDAVASGRD